MPHGNSYERSSAIDVARQLVARPATTDRLLPNRCAVADTLANYAALIGAGYAGKTGSDSTGWRSWRSLPTRRSAGAARSAQSSPPQSFTNLLP